MSSHGGKAPRAGSKRSSGEFQAWHLGSCHNVTKATSEPPACLSFLDPGLCFLLSSARFVLRKQLA